MSMRTMRKHRLHKDIRQFANLANLSRRQRLSRRQGLNRSNGLSLAETAASCFVVIFVMILSIDVWMLITAVQINDSACRDAARAAAQSSDSTTATNLAYTAVASHAQSSSAFINPPSIDNFQYQDYSSNTPPLIPQGSTPFVTVTTTCQVHPIIPLSVFGALIIDNKGIITFSQTYTFPLVKSKALAQ